MRVVATRSAIGPAVTTSSITVSAPVLAQDSSSSQVMSIKHSTVRTDRETVEVKIAKIIRTGLVKVLNCPPKILRREQATWEDIKIEQLVVVSQIDQLDGWIAQVEDDPHPAHIDALNDSAKHSASVLSYVMRPFDTMVDMLWITRAALANSLTPIDEEKVAMMDGLMEFAEELEELDLSNTPTDSFRIISARFFELTCEANEALG